MSVLKNLRGLSDMEFYKNAWRMRRELTVWIMKDFGSARNPRSAQKTIKDLSAEEAELIDAIFEAHGKGRNNQFSSQYPSWFVEQERKILMEFLARLIEKITSANSIYPIKDAEWDLRRCFQDEAIGTCYVIYQELQYIGDTVEIDLNSLIPFLEMIEREIELLKGWRSSDNRHKKKS